MNSADRHRSGVAVVSVWCAWSLDEGWHLCTIIDISVNAAGESAKKYGGGVKGDNCPAEKEAQNSLTKHIL